MRQKLMMFILVSCFSLMPVIAKASSYTTNNDLFENSYTNNLIDMSQTQVENISSKKYVIVQNDYNYYMITADKKDVTVNNNVITMNNTKIIRAIRTQNGYNTYYEYLTLEENSTTIYVNNIVLSNIDTSKSVGSNRYEEYREDFYNMSLLVVILACVFALFVIEGSRS